MPYISQEDRKTYDEKLDALCEALEEEGYDEGHVTYMLYMIVARWFKHIPKYKSIARIRGVLLGTISEFDRRIAAPYEDEKIKENGDVVLDYVYDNWDGTCGEPGCTGPATCPSCKPTPYAEETSDGHS